MPHPSIRDRGRVLQLLAGSTYSALAPEAAQWALSFAAPASPLAHSKRITPDAAPNRERGAISRTDITRKINHG
jgi:hypothetical protein